MNSSYKNKDITYGELLEAVTISINPKNIVEIGILDGYSLTHFINATNSEHTKINAYDIFEDFNGNHAHKDKIIEQFQHNNNVKISYGDFYELHKSIDNNIDILHIDIANTGDVYEYTIQNYLSKLSSCGLIILEGGSRQRDEVEWMNKYNKSKIYPTIKKYSQLYNIKTIGTFPSMTLITNK